MTVGRREQRVNRICEPWSTHDARYAKPARHARVSRCSRDCRLLMAGLDDPNQLGLGAVAEVWRVRVSDHGENHRHVVNTH